MAKYNNLNLVGFGIKNALLPTDGPKAVQVPLDFSTITTYDIELEEVQELGRLPFVQCIYVDNSLNATQTMTITIGQTNQVIKVKPNTQGYFPVLMPSTKLTVALSAAGSALTSIHLISVPMPAISWLTA